MSFYNSSNSSLPSGSSNIEEELDEENVFDTVPKTSQKPRPLTESNNGFTSSKQSNLGAFSGFSGIPSARVTSKTINVKPVSKVSSSQQPQTTSDVFPSTFHQSKSLSRSPSPKRAASSETGGNMGSDAPQNPRSKTPSRTSSLVTGSSSNLKVSSQDEIDSAQDEIDSAQEDVNPLESFPRVASPIRTTNVRSASSIRDENTPNVTNHDVIDAVNTNTNINPLYDTCIKSYVNDLLDDTTVNTPFFRKDLLEYIKLATSYGICLNPLYIVQKFKWAPSETLIAIYDKGVEKRTGAYRMKLTAGQLNGLLYSALINEKTLSIKFGKYDHIADGISALLVIPTKSLNYCLILNGKEEISFGNIDFIEGLYTGMGMFNNTKTQAMIAAFNFLNKSNQQYMTVADA